ncbi:MAG TPA: hypothetical protein VMF03_12615 [Steroidobacteraceae bacterium]|nr:hypothetical protein [Steroidobacteraceae bacterium]
MAPGHRSVLLSISVFAAPVVSAGVAPDDLGGSLALTSDYIYHGISQTCGDPATSITAAWPVS